MRLSASRILTRSASKMTMGYIRSSARDCQSRTSSSTASVTRLIRSGQTGGIEPDNLVVDPVDPGLAFFDQLRLKTAIAVARHGDWHLAVLTLQPLCGRAIAPVGLPHGRVLAILVAQMRSQLGTQHPLHELDLEFLHQPGIAEQILRPLTALQQLVQ